MKEPSMAQDLEDQVQDTVVARFKNRPNDALETIQNDIRKTLADLLDHKRRLDSFSDNLKQAVDNLQRLTG